MPTRIIFGPPRDPATVTTMREAMGGAQEDAITVTQGIDDFAQAINASSGQMMKLEQQWGQEARKVYVNPAAVRFIVDA